MHRLAILIALIVLIHNGSAQRRPGLSRFGEITPGCTSYQFKCKNGQCVSSESLCDGNVDCRDGSDETRSECSAPSSPPCNPHTFRCDYGACVDGDALCNGIKNCADNSDEDPERCRFSGSSGGRRNTTHEVNCSGSQFRCSNGQCIAGTEVCDGNIDCSDRSDETVLTCGSFNCPQYVFRCAYGACIDKDLKCNGIVNCADGSDEDRNLCGDVEFSTTRRPPRPNNPSEKDPPRPNDPFGRDPPRPNDSSGRDPPRPNDSSGRDPPRPNDSFGRDPPRPNDSFGRDPPRPNDSFGRDPPRPNDSFGRDPPRPNDSFGRDPPRPNDSFGRDPPRPNDPDEKNPPRHTPNPRPPSRPTERPTSKPPLGDLCETPDQPENGRWTLQNGNIGALVPGTKLVYKCNSGYKLYGTSDVFCGLDGKWSKIPKCQEISCPPLSSASREAICTYEDNWVSCDNPVLPRTTAQLKCRNSYTQDVTDLTRRDNIRCNAKGEWEPKPITCVSVCGVTSSSTGVPLIVNGERAMVSEFPWHATLYKAEGKTKKFICGATIITENLLVTAAHCVYDEVQKKGQNPSKFHIVTGNVFQPYDYEGHDVRTVKKARVKDIYIVCNYLGNEGNYASDIAILRINQSFVFSSITMPICLDTTSATDQATLEGTNYGKVAGFGRTGKGENSFILQSLTVPYVPLNICKSSSIASDSEKYITIDKFCAGHTNGSSVCDGDSGGGLVFKTDKKWYLRGIVSVGIGVDLMGALRTCDSHAYSLYTRVSSHMEWIQDVILRVDTNKTFPMCS